MSGFVVAGVTGRVGSVVARELLARGAKVRVVLRGDRHDGTWSERGADVARGSLGDERFVSATLRGAEGCFVLLPEDRAALDMRRERRRMADAIASGVAASGVPRVVMISSLGAELEGGNGPIGDLGYLEDALRGTGTRFAALRSSSFQENVAGMAPVAEREGIYPNLLASADVPFPTASVRDAGRLAADLLGQRPGSNEVVDLLGPAYTVRQQAAALGEALGRPLRVVDVPASARVETLVRSGVSHSVAEAYAEMFACLGAGRIAPRGDRTARGTTRLEETLGDLAARRA